MASNPNYYFGEDGTLYDRHTKQPVGTWTSKNGKRVTKLNAGATNPSSNGVPAQGGPVNNVYPTFTGPQIPPGYDPVTRAFAKGKEKSGITQLNPVIQQNNLSSRSTLQSPQLSYTTVGDKGLTPGEILNYLTEHQNELQYSQDQRRQMGLDTMRTGVDTSNKLFGQMIPQVLAALQGGVATQRQYGNEMQQAIPGTLGPMMDRIRQLYGQGMQGTAQGVGNATQSANNIIGDARTQGTNMIGGALNSANQAYSNANNAITQSIQRALGGATSALGNAQQQYNSALQQGGQQAQGYYGQARNALTQYMQQGNQQAQNQLAGTTRNMTGSLSGGNAAAQGQLSGATRNAAGALGGGNSQAQGILGQGLQQTNSQLAAGNRAAQGSLQGALSGANSGLTQGYNAGQNFLSGGLNNANRGLTQGYNASQGYLDNANSQFRSDIGSTLGRANSIYDQTRQGALSSLDNAYGQQQGYYSKGLQNALSGLGQGRSDALGDLDKALTMGRGDLTGGLNASRGLYDEAKGYVNNLGQQDIGRINLEAQKAQGAMVNNMTGRGLGNTTITNSLSGGIGRNRNDALLGVDQMRAQNFIGLNQSQADREFNFGNALANYSGGILGQRAGINNQYGQNVAGLHQSFAGMQGSAAQAYGQNRSGVQQNVGLAQAGTNASLGSQLASGSAAIRGQQAGNAMNYGQGLSGNYMNTASPAVRASTELWAGACPTTPSTSAGSRRGTITTPVPLRPLLRRPRAGSRRTMPTARARTSATCTSRWARRVPT
jgi:hypothetical protein